jgi:hypothetical protein
MLRCRCSRAMRCSSRIGQSLRMQLGEANEYLGWGARTQRVARCRVARCRG